MRFTVVDSNGQGFWGGARYQEKYPGDLIQLSSCNVVANNMEVFVENIVVCHSRALPVRAPPPSYLGFPTSKRPRIDWSQAGAGQNTQCAGAAEAEGDGPEGPELELNWSLGPEASPAAGSAATPPVAAACSSAGAGGVPAAAEAAAEPELPLGGDCQEDAGIQEAIAASLKKDDKEQKPTDAEADAEQNNIDDAKPTDAEAEQQWYDDAKAFLNDANTSKGGV